jgi:Lsr2
MAKTVIVKLTDDMDGGDADETIQFALDGQSYEIDLSTAHASELRQAFKPYIEEGTE